MMCLVAVTALLIIQLLRQRPYWAGGGCGSRDSAAWWPVAAGVPTLAAATALPVHAVAWKSEPRDPAQELRWGTLACSTCAPRRPSSKQAACTLSQVLCKLPASERACFCACAFQSHQAPPPLQHLASPLPPIHPLLQLPPPLMLHPTAPALVQSPLDSLGRLLQACSWSR